MADHDDIFNEAGERAEDQVETIIRSMPLPNLNARRRRALIAAVDSAERSRAISLWSRPVPLWKAAVAAVFAIGLTASCIVLVQPAGPAHPTPAPQPVSREAAPPADLPRDHAPALVVHDQPILPAARDRSYQPDIRSWSVLSISHGEEVP